MSVVTREEFHERVANLTNKIIDTVVDTEYDITAGILAAAMFDALANFVGQSPPNARSHLMALFRENLIRDLESRIETNAQAYALATFVGGGEA
jgi:hypothetical protein